VFTGRTLTRGHGMWGRTLAHRHSWALANGPIPVGMWVLHRCDNPPCVNPRHLYLGTIQENTADAVARGRNYHPPRKMVCSAGHAKEGDNLSIVIQDGREVYRCRICENDRSATRQREARHIRGLKKTLVSDAERARMRALRAADCSHRKIAMELGRSLMAVQRALKEMGI